MHTKIDCTFAPRLTRLCDGRLGLRSGMAVTVRAPGVTLSDDPSSSRPVLDFIASNETVDRYDEILVANGWQLENYRRNPVFQNAHQYGDILHTLGRAQVTEIREAGPAGKAVLFQRIEFAVEVNPIARIAHGLYRGGFLNAVSVGFIPLRWEDGGPDSRFRRKYLEQELLEVSAVGIPANPDALQLGLRAGAIEKSDLLEVLERIQTLTLTDAMTRAAADPSAAGTSNSIFPTPFLAVPGAHASASGTRDNEAQLLKLARALREILRRT